MAAWISASTSVLVVVLGGLLAYRANHRLGQRQDRLAWVNRQLEELYGPLLAHAEANGRAWRTFRATYRADEPAFFGGRVPPTDVELTAWFEWMTHVFMPANRASVEEIRHKAHLLEGESIPEPLLEFLAHVAGYEVVVRQWEAGDRSRPTALLNHPEDYDAYLRETFSALKREQQALLARTAARS